MANEDLFPPLDWSNWDKIPEAHNRQRFLPDEARIQQLTDELTTARDFRLNRGHIVKGSNWIDNWNRSNSMVDKEHALIKEIQLEAALNPYNYVPPRHALEPHMGFEINPNNAYRMMGERVIIPQGVDPASVLKDKTIALQDFLNTGQVRGNPAKVNGGRVFLPLTPEQAAQTKAAKIAAGGTIKLDLTRRTELPQAYFMPRHIQPTYYTTSDLTPQVVYRPTGTSGKPAQILASANDGYIGQNTMIEVNKDFAPINQRKNPSSRNPLYYMGNQLGDDATAFRLRGGLWGENTGAGAHITANPRENPSFFDVANPANRKGIRILQESAPAVTTDQKISINNRAIYGKVHFGTTGESIPSNIDPSLLEVNADGYSTTVKPNQTAGTAPEASKIKWTTKYDRITPFSQRPIATHIANAKAEAEIFLNAAKTSPLSNKIGSLGAAAGKMGALSAVGNVAGGVFTPIQIGMQTNALTKDNVMDREYGHSDPLALRPAIDLMLSGIGNNQTPAEGWKSMGKMVADPEWQVRNPISAVPYNLAHGNMEPVKAFFGGYVPDFLK